MQCLYDHLIIYIVVFTFISHVQAAQNDPPNTGDGLTRGAGPIVTLQNWPTRNVDRSDEQKPFGWKTKLSQWTKKLLPWKSKQPSERVTEMMNYRGPKLGRTASEHSPNAGVRERTFSLPLHLNYNAPRNVRLLNRVRAQRFFRTRQAIRDKGGTHLPAEVQRNVIRRLLAAEYVDAALAQLQRCFRTLEQFHVALAAALNSETELMFEITIYWRHARNAPRLDAFRGRLLAEAREGVRRREEFFAELKTLNKMVAELCRAMKRGVHAPREQVVLRNAGRLKRIFRWQLGDGEHDRPTQTRIRQIISHSRILEFPLEDPTLSRAKRQPEYWATETVWARICDCQRQRRPDGLPAQCPSLTIRPGVGIMSVQLTRNNQEYH